MVWKVETVYSMEVSGRLLLITNIYMNLFYF